MAVGDFSLSLKAARNPRVGQCWRCRLRGDASDSAGIRDRGFQFLRAAQLADGSWAASPDVTTGCWVTSLACWVLLADAHAQQAVAAGLKWLCDDWPRDSAPWRRLLARFSSEHKISAQNDSLRGWGWTPGTSSWVEPTSFALILLARAPREAWPPGADRRRELAKANAVRPHVSRRRLELRKPNGVRGGG